VKWSGIVLLSDAFYSPREYKKHCFCFCFCFVCFFLQCIYFCVLFYHLIGKNDNYI